MSKPYYEQVPVNAPTLAYPFKIKWLQTLTMGAAATQKNFELARSPIAAIILQMDMLGNAAAATLANALTQLATTMKVTDGGEDITPNWSGAEWAEYFAAFFGRSVPFQDGTAADNKLALLTLVIPFGRPQASVAPSLWSLYDEKVGFVPTGVPQLEISYPADGNSIDNRHLKVGVVYMNHTPQYKKKWSSYSSQTLNTTGNVDWILPEVGLLCEMFMYQTSSYNDTLTSDAPTLLKWDLTQKGKSMISDGEMFNMFGALVNTTFQADDDYLLVPFVKQPVDDFSLMPKLGVDTRFLAFGGVADAFSMAVSRLVQV